MDEVPLLVAIDDPFEELAPIDSNAFHSARHHFAQPVNGHEDDFLQLMRQNFRHAPNGIFYYRGHLYGGSDAAGAALNLPTHHAECDDYGTLQAGQLFGKLPDGTPWMPLPRRVVLSCCSSSASGLLHGEAIGLAAACMAGGGASEVIATCIDVRDSSFTAALDVMILQVAKNPAPLSTGLSGLHRTLYRDWQKFSLRGGIHDMEDIDFPHPMIWAMYQAH